VRRVLSGTGTGLQNHSVYYPYTKTEGMECVRPYLRICRDRFGAELRPLRATKSAVLWYQARKDLAERNPGAYLFPNGLKLNESIEETRREVLTTPPGLMNGTWVVSVSSGAIAKGVAKALAQVGFGGTLVLHMGYSRSRDGLLRYMGEYLHGYKVEVVDEAIDRAISFSMDMDEYETVQLTLAGKGIEVFAQRTACKYRETVPWEGKAPTIEDGINLYVSSTMMTHASKRSLGFHIREDAQKGMRIMFTGETSQHLLSTFQAKEKG